ncbi:DUF1330 domain-containing protein [Rhizobiaceae bacterium]|nr:DUF1330 domain-containing protein [Rhizobiaceae bacterium]
MSDGHIDPTRDAFAAMKGLPLDQPVEMLNLVALRERATYEDKREVSGKEAYAEYGRSSGPIFAKVGGTIIWRGRPELILIGPDTERWDVAFIARYPTAQAFIDMVRDEKYRAIVFHRQAAVETSRLIRMAPLDGSGKFG